MEFDCSHLRAKGIDMPLTSMPQYLRTLLLQRPKRFVRGLLLPYCCQRALATDPVSFGFLAICRTFRSALGRTRTCDLLIRSQIRGAIGMRKTRIGKRISVRQSPPDVARR
jgi:hypothetical protein